MISTTFGVGVFLLLLLMATHALVNLWVRSTVEAVALDAANRVAMSPDDPRELAGSERAALAEARRRLGAFSDEVRLRFEPDPTRETVVLHVSTDGLSLVPDFARAALDVGALDRRVVVRREAMR